MKKTFTFIAAILFASSSIAQQDTIASWTFPSSNLSDTIADISNALNQSAYISTTTGVSSITMKNGITSKAAQATGWDDGMNAKSWKIEINTTGMENITLSSKQTAGKTNAGPRDFKLQYKVGSGSWTSVSGATVTVANDWTTGVLTDISLPAECNNEASVRIRWRMTSNIDINGDTVLSTGTAKIDDILIVGDASTDIENVSLNPTLNIYPNPCREHITIESGNEIARIEIYSAYGSKVVENDVNAMLFTVDMELSIGFYTMIIYHANDIEPIKRKIVVN